MGGVTPTTHHVIPTEVEESPDAAPI
jgi:hypothetical protein